MFKRASKISAPPEKALPNPKNYYCPSEYNPNALYGILYPYGGKFVSHIDGAQGWVLAISIGDSANFFFSDGFHGERTYVRLDSGDAIVFNGGQLHHGVEEIYSNTAPAFWTDPNQEISIFGMSRFNMQFRDPVRDRLTYYPKFDDKHTNEYERSKNGLVY